MSLLEVAGSPQLARRVAARNALWFAVAGLLWVLITDTALHATVSEDRLVARIATLKGWVFVSLSALFVYEITRRSFTRLQRSEATTRAVLNGIGDGILLVGQDTRVVDANPRAMAMLGVRDKRELIGMDAPAFSRRFHLTYPDGSLVPVGNYISQRALKGETCPPYKGILHPPSRLPVTITATAAPVRIDPGGPVDLAVSVMRDVTALEALDRLRDEFFAAAAHSLKTPVTVIKSHAQLLSSRAESPLERLSADAIDRQCGKIDQLVQNLIVLSRFQSGTMSLQPKEVDLLSVAATVTAGMKKAMPQRRLREIAREQPRVYADPERLALVIRNLLERAYNTALPDTEVELLLQQEGARARLGVRYQPSVDPHEAARPSWELRGTAGVTDYHYLGLDLGTHVSEKLIQAHGGSLRVEVSSGLTTTWVELPSQEASAHVGA